MKLRPFDPHETIQMDRLAGKPLASFSSRGIAFSVDALCGTAFCFVLVFLLAIADFTFFHTGPAGETFSATVLREMVDTGFGMQKRGGDVVVAVGPESGVFVAVSIGLYFALMTFIGNGKTVGKKIVGIRAVSLVHDRITLWQSIERALGYSVSMAEAGFGFLQYFIHPNRRTVHDRIAETIVIKDRKA